MYSTQPLYTDFESFVNTVDKAATKHGGGGVAGVLRGGEGRDSSEALGALSRVIASHDSSDQMYKDKAAENINAGLGFRCTRTKQAKTRMQSSLNNTTLHKTNSEQN